MNMKSSQQFHCQIILCPTLLKRFCKKNIHRYLNKLLFFALSSESILLIYAINCVQKIPANSTVSSVHFVITSHKILSSSLPTYFIILLYYSYNYYQSIVQLKYLSNVLKLCICFFGAFKMFFLLCLYITKPTQPFIFFFIGKLNSMNRF